MASSFKITVTDPMAIVYSGKLEAYTKLTAALNEMMESISKVIGPDHFKVHIFYDDSSHLYTDFGNPIRCLYEIGTVVQEEYRCKKRLQTRLYVNSETDKALGWVNNVYPPEELCGNLDIVVKFLAAEILKWVFDRTQN